MRKEVLRLERVTYRHDNTTILNNFSMSMMKGEIMGLQPLETYGLDELLYVLTENPPLYFGYVYYMEQCVNSWQDSRRGRNRISIGRSSAGSCEGPGAGRVRAEGDSPSCPE